MERIHKSAQGLSGLITRTNNAAETEAETARIGPLWQQYFAENDGHLTQGKPMYGVYHDYQSDMNGDYSVLVGTQAESDDICDIRLAEGDYLKFSGSGKMPDCVVEQWTEIWRYFSSPECRHQRNYLTDYEVYPDTNGVDIYIGINR
ncbi:transcription activator, effector binding [Shewanella sediminis HAW-EB3]|uniref:Transcription activator, effector binding n=1 Tax=Shewanella sediminis (strain HAW-EB3) TaxID=425104 RepID=A8FX20_SHESH|nr:GyrI-like domain-containing protein [Shewanella sediminis]ABV37393.1 transcription activator, effector binding [Shewanella sediminis HAW-EB3]